jgi:hypothetical protein
MYINDLNGINVLYESHNVLLHNQIAFFKVVVTPGIPSIAACEVNVDSTEDNGNIVTDDKCYCRPNEHYIHKVAMHRTSLFLHRKAH